MLPLTELAAHLSLDTPMRENERARRFQAWVRGLPRSGSKA